MDDLTTPGGSPGPTRRQIITGRYFSEVAGDLDSDVTPALGEESATACLLHLSRRAMACQFEVILHQAAPEGIAEAAVEALDLVDRLEAQLSVYRNDSEVSMVNQLAVQHPVPVEAGLFELFQRCLNLQEATQGAFDITSTPLSKLWGFYRREGSMPPKEAISSLLQGMSAQQIMLDVDLRTIHFSCNGLEVNFNGIGKGYALDRCRQHLVDRGAQNFLLHGGRSSLSAWGNRSGREEDRDGWTVALRHPLRPEERVFEIRLCNQGLGTSGAATQSFTYQGRRYGHILDPRTGWPASGVLSATVLAADAALADALSTAFYVLGAEQAMEYCDKHGDLAAIIIVPGKRSGNIEAHTFGLTDDQLRPCAKQPFGIIRHDADHEGDQAHEGA